jgi:hypothetical protein
VRLALPPAKYSDGEVAKQFYDQLASRLQSVPGVDSLGAISALPMSGLTARTEFLISGKPPARPTDVPGAQHRWVTPGYFASMHMPLLRGRDFTEHDRKESAGVVVIDEALRGVLRGFGSDWHSPSGNAWRRYVRSRLRNHWDRAKRKAQHAH